MYGSEITEEDKAWQLDGEDPIAEVDKILSSRGTGRKIKYLVKWVGSEKTTWEPLSHLKGAKDAVMDYNAVSGRQPVQAAPLTSPCTNPLVTRVKDKAKGRSKANPNVDVSLPTYP